jgi:hypothetical protein
MSDPNHKRPKTEGRGDEFTGVFERLQVGGQSEATDGNDGSFSPSVPRKPLYRADPDRILRVLAANQFEDPFLAFREIYANALDSVRGRDKPRIDISIATDLVVIEDNGLGLDESALEALTTLGASTRRGHDAIGRFGIGFASAFDPVLGVRLIEFLASRPGYDRGVQVDFRPDASGGVGIQVEENSRSKTGGSRIQIHFDSARAPKNRVAKIIEVFETHAAYSGIQTFVNGRDLGKDLSEYIKSEIQIGKFSSTERDLIAASAVRGAVGVAAIDPTRSEAKYRAYQRGLYVGEIVMARVTGQPWIRGVFGAVHAEGLDLVASRNAFVENENFERFQHELQKLAFEASYRVVRLYETSMDAYARIVLLDAIRRGLRTTTPEGLMVASTDLFSTAIVRSPLFRAWGNSKRYSFEELVSLKENEGFRALAYRPSLKEQRKYLVFRADDSLERDIFRKISGMREMPGAARAENVSKPSLLSRLMDRTMSGPKAEYSLFQRRVPPENVSPEIRRVVAALNEFLATEEVALTFSRLMPGALPILGYGISRNAFGPVAAYCLGEIRFNIRHRSLRKLSREPNPELAARALLPVLAHELAHVCHELHDLDFYRTCRTLLRALVVAAAKSDCKRLTSSAS